MSLIEAISWLSAVSSRSILDTWKLFLGSVQAFQRFCSLTDGDAARDNDPSTNLLDQAPIQPALAWHGG